MILFINSCIRKESRTKHLANALIEKLKMTDQDVKEIELAGEELKPLSEERLNLRTEFIAKGDYSHPMFDLAKQFAAADTIVIAAPYWDLSFPSVLKIYFENIYVTGIVSKYSEEGLPVGLCKADRLFYVTTCGGPYIPDYSFGYIKTMAEKCFGIGETKLFAGEMLDVEGVSVDEQVEKCIKEIEEYFS